MFKILRLALRNVKRNKRRSIITLIMISFGMVVTIFISGFLNSMSGSLVDSLIEGSTGEIQVMARGYKKQDISANLDYTITSLDNFKKDLKQEESITGLTSKVSVEGLISNGEKSISCFGTAVKLDTVDKALPQLLKEGDGSERKLKIEGVNGAIIGAGLAEKLDVQIGDTLFLVSYDKSGEMNEVKLTISDIAQYTTDVENDSKIIMSYQNASYLYGLEDEATAVSLRIADRNNLESVLQNLQNKYGEKYNVKFYSWENLMGSYSQTIGMFNAVKTIILLIMSVVVLIGVINTILMSVFERTDEIGTLKAIGTSQSRIISMFMAESFWLGLIGTILGAMGGIIIIYLTGIKGIPFSAPGTTQTYYIKPVLKSGMILAPSLVLLIVSMLAGIYPARFAAKLEPIDAIRRT